MSYKHLRSKLCTRFTSGDVIKALRYLTNTNFEISPKGSTPFVTYVKNNKNSSQNNKVRIIIEFKIIHFCPKSDYEPGLIRKVKYKKKEEAHEPNTE